MQIRLKMLYISRIFEKGYAFWCISYLQKNILRKRDSMHQITSLSLILHLACRDFHHSNQLLIILTKRYPQQQSNTDTID